MNSRNRIVSEEAHHFSADRDIGAPLGQNGVFNLNRARLRKHQIFIDGDCSQSKIAVSAYKHMRTHVLKEMEQRKISAIMVTSVTADAGKTTTSINLAISIAKHLEKRVVLVDFDLRKPSFRQIFGIPIDYGIDNVLDSDFSVGKAMLYPDLERLYILPCARSHINSTEILMSMKMKQLITSLRRFDSNHVVIFDTPPILGCDDVSAVTSVMDGALLVIGEGDTSRTELRQATRALGNLPILSTVMNRSTEAKFQQYYY